MEEKCSDYKDSPCALVDVSINSDLVDTRGEEDEAVNPDEVSD